jgi:predicted phosphodiesterase
MNQLILTGDWHIQSGTPKCRLDEDFLKTQMDKVASIFNTAEELSIKYVLQAGDLTEHFPHPKFPWHLAQTMVRFLKAQKATLITTFGNHDMNYHSDTVNTPLCTMEAAGALHVTSHNEPLIYPNLGIKIHGCCYGEEIPTLTESDKKTFTNILLAHIFVSDIDYWWGNVKYADAKRLLEETEFDLIVTGDHHKTFAIRTDGSKGARWLVNPGSILRTTIDQVDHKPAIFIYDIEHKYPFIYLLPVRPPEEVINVEHTVTVKEEERGKETEAFVAKFSGTVEISGLDFLQNLNEAIAKLEEGVISIIKEATKVGR